MGFPIQGTLERLLMDKLLENGDKGVTYLDFVGTGITEENIDALICNLRTGMYISETDDELKEDA